MMRKRWVRLVFILIPLLLLTFQMFWKPTNRPHRVRAAIQALVPPAGLLIRYFDFNEQNALARWEEKLFQGRVDYWIDFEHSTSGFVHAKSNQSASAIFYRIKFDISDYPYVSWKWRVEQFPDKSKTQDPKKLDDFAARFYVVFVSRFFTQFKCIEYVWDETLAEDTVLDSPYAEQIKQIVIQSGPNPSGEWVSETRNVYEDYQKLFGQRPKMKVTAIALMTSSAGTQTEAEAYFDDIQIGKVKSI